MKKMLITLVIEGTSEDLNQIKGTIISKASECLVSCKTDIIEEQREIQIPCCKRV